MGESAPESQQVLQGGYKNECSLQRYAPASHANAVICRELYRKQEELGKEGPGIAYANQCQSFSPTPRNRCASFGTANKSHERHLWRKQEQCAQEVPGAGAYDAYTSGALTNKGLARRSSRASIGNARKSHSRNLWAAEEKNAAEVPGAGSYNTLCTSSIANRITPGSAPASREQSYASRSYAGSRRSSLMSASTSFSSAFEHGSDMPSARRSSAHKRLEKEDLENVFESSDLRGLSPVNHELATAREDKKYEYSAPSYRSGLDSR